MTVIVQTPVNSFTANGATTLFNFTFKLINAADLDVYVSDTLKTLGADYTISGLGNSAGGSVTFITAPANTSIVVLQRNSDLERPTDYKNNGDFLSDTVNADFDRLWLAMQELTYKYKLAPTLKPGSPLVGTINLPSPVAGKFVRWNSAATNLELADLSFDNISYTLLSAGPVPVQTLSLLRLVVPNYIGQVFELTGRTAAGTGGGSWYYAGQVANVSSDNDGTIAVSSVGGLFYEFRRQQIPGLIYENWFANRAAALTYARAQATPVIMITSVGLEVINDASALDYVGTKAVSVFQKRDTAALGLNGFSPAVVFQSNSTGNGSVTAGSELSQSIWQGVFSSSTKTGDGSIHSYTATAQLGAYGAGGYNEAGLFQGEATNIGSLLGTMSGCEMLLKDSPDSGATTYSTKMQAIVGRLAKYNPTIRKSFNFYASSEGTLPPNAVLGANTGGLASWQRGIDFQGITFSTGQVTLFPNNTSMAWLTVGAVAVPVIGVDTADICYLQAPTNTTAGGVSLRDNAGVSRLRVPGSGGIIRFDNATISAAATAGVNGAPPAQVSGYCNFLINGTQFKFPYYNV